MMRNSPRARALALLSWYHRREKGPCDANPGFHLRYGHEACVAVMSWRSYYVKIIPNDGWVRSPRKRRMQAWNALILRDE